MQKGRISASGINTDARLGFSKSKGVFGYKLHMSCSAGRLAVPLTAWMFAVVMHDPHMYDVLVEPLAGMVSYYWSDKKIFSFLNYYVNFSIFNK